MSFRKGPFQFGDIDPTKRREEILKRFGLRSDEGSSMFCEPSPMTANWPDWQGRMPRRTCFEEPEWRTRTGSFGHTSSNPGSPHFPRSGAGMPHTPTWMSDEETIPIRVMHEKGNLGNRPDDSAESDSSSHSSQSSSSQKRTEPRVHHIPIMIEPRDGSASSGYASCDETKSANHDTTQERSPQEPTRWSSHNAPPTRMNYEPSATANGACRQSPGQPPYQSPVQDSPSTPKSSPMNTPQPISDASPFGARAKVHSIPIKIENDHAPGSRPTPLRSQSAKVATSPSKPSPVNRSASSPLGGQYKSTSRGAQCGKAQPKQGSSAPCSPSGAGGPYVTKVPINVQNQGPQQKDESCRSRQGPSMTPPPSHQGTPSKSPSGPLEKIADIRKEVERLMKCVEEFQGTAGDKEYKYLDEMLTRCMLRLDGIDTGGRDDIRQQRKACVNEVHQCVAQLEAKGKKSMPSNSGMQNNTTEESAKKKFLTNPDQQASEQETMQVEESQGTSAEMSSKEEQMQVDESHQKEDKVDTTPSQAASAEQNMENNALSSDVPQITGSEEGTYPEAVSNDTPIEMKEQSQTSCQQEATVETNNIEQLKASDNPAQPESTKNLPTVHRTEVTLNVSGESTDPSVQQTKL